MLPFLTSPGKISRPLTIERVIDDPEGKWPESLGNVVLVDMLRLGEDIRRELLNVIRAIRSVLPLLPPGPLSPLVIARINQLVSNFTVNDFALTSIIQYRDRADAYIKDQTALDADMIEFSNQASEALGVTFPASFELPIVKALQITYFIRLFLDNVFGAVLSLLFLLGMLLIYSLLLSDVQGKTYEYGMLRALGMKHFTLVQIILIKSLSFSTMGISLGLLFAFLFNIPVSQSIADFAVITPKFSLAPNAILAAVALGLVMPLIANVVPIQRALSSTLRDSLDMYHHVINEVSVKVLKLSEMGLDLWESALSIFLVVVGFVTFYLIPYAFTFRDYAMFFGIFNAILLGMLLGLAVVASLVQPLLEQIMLRLLVWGPHACLRPIVRKNLAGHRDRNSKTAQMFTICLAFIIFAGVMFSLQSRSIQDNVKVLFGADIMVRAFRSGDALRETEMSAFLDQQILRRKQGDPYAVVEDYTFVTYDLRSLSAVQSISLQNLAQFPSFNQFIYGVSPNFLKVTYSDYAMVTEPTNAGAATSSFPKTESGNPDPIAALYQDGSTDNWLPPVQPQYYLSGIDSSKPVNYTQLTRDFVDNMRQAYGGHLDGVVTEALRDYASIDLTTPLNMKITVASSASGKVVVDYMCKPRAMVRKLPGFVYSSYRQTVRISPLLIRMPQYEALWRQIHALANISISDTDQPPKSMLLVKLTPGTSRDLREDVLNGLRTFFKSDATISIDTLTVIERAKTATELMNLFFNVVGLIAMVLCFFILLLSFTANVHQNSWEFGVLRAIGLSAFRVVMVYIYEALALILACVVLGTIVGILIAISLTLQFNLFTEMPFAFEFPFALFFSMLGMALVVALLGSYLPARFFLNKSISNTIRGT
eukprot:TRINITY_DN11415_c0_g1_i4.p1 TRINITY_DN11415_c0_g1~~TRINITY_DN11415_c0_g1_i4.p1  ORF type:complete len:879 (-),score=175.03 TRINITY_DN11415_c0_g1_i4:116-2752(-)